MIALRRRFESSLLFGPVATTAGERKSIRLNKRQSKHVVRPEDQCAQIFPKRFSAVVRWFYMTASALPSNASAKPKAVSIIHRLCTRRRDGGFEKSKDYG